MFRKLPDQILKPMIKHILLLFLTALQCTVLRAQQTPDTKIGFQFNGAVSEKVLLAYYYGNKQYVRDTLTTDQTGKCSIQSEKLLAAGIYILSFPQHNRAQMEIILDKDQQFTVKASVKDLVGTASFEGSEDNKLFYDHLGKLRTFKDPSAATVKAYRAYMQQLCTAHPNSFLVRMETFKENPVIPDSVKSVAARKYYYKAHFLDKADWQFGQITRTPVYAQFLAEYMDQVTEPVTDSLIRSCDRILAKSASDPDLFQFTLSELLNRYAKSKAQCQDAIYVYLVDQYFNTGKATWMDPTKENYKKELKRLRETADRLRPLICGTPAFNFSLPDSSGTVHSLYDVKAAHTLLIFWSAECHMCETFMSGLDSLSTLCQQKGVRVVTVDSGQHPDLWREKIVRHRATNMLALASSDVEILEQLIDHYDIYATPTVFLLDESKRIESKNLTLDLLKGLLPILPDQ